MKNIVVTLLFVSGEEGKPETFDCEYQEKEVAARAEVCYRCEGKGSHVNPSIDGNGLSSEDLADDDFRESYFRGDYDVRCEVCKGENVIWVADVDRLSKEDREAYERNQEEVNRSNAEAAAEERYWQRCHDAAASRGW